MDIIKLINQYAPICYIHPYESYMPMSIEDYLKICDVTDDKGNILVKGPLTSRILHNNYQPDGVKSKHLQLSPTNGYDDPALRGNSNISNVPFYVNYYYENNYIFINYMFFYGYNAVTTVLGGLIATGEHFSDIEHITVKVNTATQKIVDVYYGAHSGGELVSDFPSENGHPIVYIAKGTHASYPTEGLRIRYYGFGSDHTLKAMRWSPTKLIILFDPKYQKNQYNPDTMGFLMFRGNMGRSHVSNMIDKSWWRSSRGNDNEPQGKNFNEKTITISFGISSGISMCILIYALLYFRELGKIKKWSMLTISLLVLIVLFAASTHDVN